jgi:hypothetical protein
MRSLFTLMRFYPYWAVPVGIVVVELGLYCRRRRISKQWLFFAVGATLFATSIAWVALRGDLHSDAWVKRILLRDP